MASSGTLSIFKGSGAAKFTVIPPKREGEKAYVKKNGAVLLEAAPPAGKKQWDWNQKINFAISVQDICDLVDSNPKKRRLYHDQGKNPNSASNASKTLEFTPGEGQFEGTWMMHLTQRENGNSQTVRVPLSNGEHQILMRLLVGVVPSLLGWPT